MSYYPSYGKWRVFSVVVKCNVCRFFQDGPDDLQNFDIEFLEQPVTASVCCDSESRLSVSVMEADDAFLGFSYAPPVPDDFR